eukprot:Skav206832  [mRNA]  locus=scaffold3672:155622:159132:+ [translate_table: standard]
MGPTKSRQFIFQILAIALQIRAATSDLNHGFKVPPFLNCEGPPFHPIWSVFRESAVANARAGYPRNESLREMAVELIATFEPSMVLGTRSWVVQLRSAATGDTYHLRLGRTSSACYRTSVDGPRIGAFLMVDGDTDAELFQLSQAIAGIGQCGICFGIHQRRFGPQSRHGVEMLRL